MRVPQLRLSHYSAEPIEQIRSVPQKDIPDMKPQGFWFSVDGRDDWLQWCNSEKFQLHKVKLRYRVALDMSRILVLSTPQELDDFTTGFLTVAPWEKGRPGSTDLRMWMNWGAVAELYAGIIIAPYQWERRLLLMWYYGWDCASGCVWDATAVRSIKLLRGKNLDRHRNAK